MATRPIIEPVRGFIHVSGPVTVFSAPAGETIYAHALVTIHTDGKVYSWTAGTSPAGVAIHGGLLNESISINIDPEAIYEASTIAVFPYVAIRSVIGATTAVTAENSSLTISGNSSMLVDAANATYDPMTTGVAVVIIGTPRSVQAPSWQTNRKILVKLATGLFEPNV
jgi:hypothetical protein